MQRISQICITRDTMTVDMEVMTLKGIHIFWQDKHYNEKTFIPDLQDGIHSLQTGVMMRRMTKMTRPGIP